MSDRVLPVSDCELVERVAEFARSIEGVEARWTYCFDQATYRYSSAKYGTFTAFIPKAFAACDRVLGRSKGAVKFRLLQIKTYGLREAIARNKAGAIFNDAFSVGPFQPWLAGHVYFARPKAFPHIVKIGFSRRVKDRLEDISSKTKEPLFVREGELLTGTSLDEIWWHNDWRAHRITGEWFFDPRSNDRTLPDFLTPAASTSQAQPVSRRLERDPLAAAFYSESVQ